MCVGCGGTCEGETGPKFVTPQGYPNLRVVGSNNAPTMLPPDSVVRATPNGMLTYEDLYTGLGPDGKPALLTTLGTFGSYATAAGKGR
jgi:hypothetical protein